MVALVLLLIRRGLAPELIKEGETNMNSEAEVLLEEDTQKNKFLTFVIGNENYGIYIKVVTEIIGIQTITTIPEMPDYVKGIINLRGKINPVIDMRLKFKKNYVPYNDRTCIVIIEVEGIAVGLIVDSVSEVIEIAEENIVLPPNVKNNSNKYVKEIGKVGTEVKLILDYYKLIFEVDS